jgi:hypothetical protein
MTAFALVPETKTSAASGNVCPGDAAVTSSVVTSYKRRGT